MLLPVLKIKLRVPKKVYSISFLLALPRKLILEWPNAIIYGWKIKDAWIFDWLWYENPCPKLNLQICFLGSLDGPCLFTERWVIMYHYAVVALADEEGYEAYNSISRERREYMTQLARWSNNLPIGYAWQKFSMIVYFFTQNPNGFFKSLLIVFCSHLTKTSIILSTSVLEMVRGCSET